MGLDTKSLNNSGAKALLNLKIMTPKVELHFSFNGEPCMITELRAKGFKFSKVKNYMHYKFFDQLVKDKQIKPLSNHLKPKP